MAPRCIHHSAIVLCGALLVSCASLKTKDHKDDYGIDDTPAYELTLDPVVISPDNTYRGAAEKKFQIIHTSLDLTPDWQHHWLNGKAVITLAAYGYPQDTLELGAKSFDLKSVSLGEGGRSLKYEYDGEKLKIALGRKYNPGEKLEVAIEYIAMPEDQYSKGIINSRSNQGLYFINPEKKDSLTPREMWTQGETEHNSAWFPTIDHPNQKFTQEFHITVDTALSTLANGVLTYSNVNRDGTRTDVWEMNKPNSAYLAMVAAGEWKVVEDKPYHDSIPLAYYVEKEYVPYAKMEFGRTAEMLGFYSKLLGVEYPWAKFYQLVARDFVSGAMENTSCVVHYDGLLQDDRSRLDQDNDNIICHEMFHHWFGDLVTCESWDNLALNESFATLGEYLWEEYKNGPEASAFHRMNDLQAYLAEATYKKQPIFYHYYSDPEKLFDRHRYEKGGLTLYMLMKYLGDSVFFQGIHNYLLDHAYGNVEESDLRKALEDASGKDLGDYFTQWFDEAGHPVVTVVQEFDRKAGELRLYFTQMQQRNNTGTPAKNPDLPYYHIPLQIKIINADGKMVNRKFDLTRKQDTLRIPMSAPPKWVDADADMLIPGIISQSKPVSQLYFQLVNNLGYAQDAEAISRFTDRIGKISRDSLVSVIRTAIAKPFWATRKQVIDVLLMDAPADIRNEFDPEIRKIALEDNNARVRLSALQYMNTRRDVSYIDIYKQALNDSSYMVVSEAIRGLQLRWDDTAGLLKTVSAYEKYRSGDVLLAVADVYSAHPDINKLGFFHYIAGRVPSSQIGHFLEDYRKFLFAFDDSMIKNELNFIGSVEYRIKDPWAKVSYKAFLTSLINRLKNIKPSNSRLTADERHEIIRVLNARADSLNSTFGN